MIKVSIIVPIYNNDKYLKRCIDSLVNQTLYEIEIILVNDGSTDDSLLICREYAEKDERIRVINKSNGGVSSARNIGIEKAQGEFLAFVDSDDFVDENMYKSMYLKVKNEGSDCCICNIEIHTKDDKNVIKNIIGKSKIIGNEIYEFLVLNLIAAPYVTSCDRMTTFRGPCTYLYKRQIIREYDIQFNENLCIGEDFLFNLQYMTKINSLSIEENSFYRYCINSISATQKYSSNCWGNHKKLIEEVKNYINVYYLGRNLDAQFIQRCNVMIFSYLSTIALNEVKTGNPKSLYQRIKYLRNVMSDEIIVDALKNYNPDKATTVQKLYLLCIKFKFSSIFYFYYKMQERKIHKRY